MAQDAASSSPASQAILARIGRIGALVDALVDEIVALREHLEADEILLPHWYSYRLAVILSRVDHAGAEIVLSQGRRGPEADGQMIAFEDGETSAT